ncbi:T9SS type A sorting domain-containing protein [Pontibacter oryzae]|uniref:T9SS C-terminal target domain-containing protein n=1 Tax=Pontibacter oryzae TaxID=2304593 RepID=A0A399S2C2_9BACT|nr:T9SS type A sorting domain-containing protein [Pontibacter oryzae]RIJ37421.1 T9SS C-terminal target domain-containing protein [Pontibacter oryzae]
MTRYTTISKFSSYFLLLPLLVLGAASAFGQVGIEYNSTTKAFNAYSQAFNSGLATVNGRYTVWANGGAGSQPGWYLGIENQDIKQVYVVGSDGVYSTPYTTGFSYGENGNADRAIGYKGKAGEQNVLYAALRMKNNSGKVIKNFDINFAIEQWYYGGEVTGIDLEYAIGPNVISATTTQVTWYPLTQVESPVKGGAVGSRKGNESGNRVAKAHTLENINLPANQEIVFRWVLKLTKDNTGFNGLALDDVTITPKGVGSDSDVPVQKAVVYYNKADKKLDDTKSWGTEPDGSGTNPRNFTDPYQTFVIKNFEEKDEGKKKKYREDDFTLSLKSKEGWTVSGERSKVVLGDGTKPVKVVLHKDKFYYGPLDLAAGSTLVINTDKNTASKLPVFGKLDPTSTVVYSDSTNLDIPNVAYGNLVVLGNEYSKKNIVAQSLAESLTITGKLELNGKKLKLSKNSLTISRGGVLDNAGEDSYVIAEDGGTLNRTVAADAGEVLFPVGTSESYAPVKIKSDGRALNYKVSVKQGVINTGILNGLTEEAISGKTWVIEKQVLASGTPASTVVLEWAPESIDGEPFDLNKVFVGRLNSRTGKWELRKPVSIVKNETSGLYELSFTDDFGAANTTDGNSLRTATRSTNSVFSTSYTTNATAAESDSYERNEVAVFASPAPLPVELVSFSAARNANKVELKWKTATETENEYFEVQYSADGFNFKVAGRVEGAGNSSVTRNYTFLHVAPTNDELYYRLAQTDTDGTINYSKIVKVAGRNYTFAQLNVYPNPTTSSLSFTERVEEAVVRNLQGQELKRFENVHELSLTEFSAGVYLVQAKTQEGVQQFRVVKK